MRKSLRHGRYRLRRRGQGKNRLWQVRILRNVSCKLPIRRYRRQGTDIPAYNSNEEKEEGHRYRSTCICRSVRTKGKPWKAHSGNEEAWLCRRGRGSNRCRPLFHRGSKGLHERSSWTSAIHGDIMLSCMVSNGEETFPYPCPIHFNGFDPNGTYSKNAQKGRSWRLYRIYRTMCGKEAWSFKTYYPQRRRLCAYLWRTHGNVQCQGRNIWRHYRWRKGRSLRGYRWRTWLCSKRRRSKGSSRRYPQAWPRAWGQGSISAGT